MQRPVNLGEKLYLTDQEIAQRQPPSRNRPKTTGRNCCADARVEKFAGTGANAHDGRQRRHWWSTRRMGEFELTPE
jgi:hypothetical protein